jgi:hypothetical protein
MNTHLRGTEGERRQATRATPGNRRSRPRPGHQTARAPVAVTWACARLRRQIQQAGAALAPPLSPSAGGRTSLSVHR